MSAAPTFNTRHTVTGKIQRLTADQIRPFKDVLEIVADDAKPYEPGLFKPGTVGEFKNPEPPTDAVTTARAQYDSVLEEGHAPNSRAAREAKAALDAAVAEAESAEQEAAKAAEAEGVVTGAETPEGDTK